MASKALRTTRFSIEVSYEGEAEKQVLLSIEDSQAACCDFLYAMQGKNDTTVEELAKWEADLRHTMKTIADLRKHCTTMLEQYDR